MILHKENNVFDQIQNMLKAYYPVLYLTTFEYDRTKDKIKGIAKELKKDYTYYEWNCVDGLNKSNLETDEIENLPDKEDPEELLKYVAASRIQDKKDNECVDKESAEIFVLEDFHEYIKERNIIVRLRQLAEKYS